MKEYELSALIVKEDDWYIARRRSAL